LSKDARIPIRDLEITIRRLIVCLGRNDEAEARNVEGPPGVCRAALQRDDVVNVRRLEDLRYRYPSGRRSSLPTGTWARAVPTGYGDAV